MVRDCAMSALMSRRASRQSSAPRRWAWRANWLLRKGFMQAGGRGLVLGYLVGSWWCGIFVRRGPAWPHGLGACGGAGWLRVVIALRAQERARHGLRRLRAHVGVAGAQFGHRAMQHLLRQAARQGVEHGVRGF